VVAKYYNVPVKRRKILGEVEIDPVGAGVERKRSRDVRRKRFQEYNKDPSKFLIGGGKELKKGFKQIVTEIVNSNSKKVYFSTHGLKMRLLAMIMLGIDFHKHEAVSMLLLDNEKMKNRIPNLGSMVFAFDPSVKTDKWTLLVGPDNTYLPRKLQGRVIDDSVEKKEYVRLMGIFYARNRATQKGNVDTGGANDWYPKIHAITQPNDKEQKIMFEPYEGRSR